MGVVVGLIAEAVGAGDTIACQSSGVWTVIQNSLHPRK